MDSRIFAITRQGLVALALAVGALWTCVGMEAATRRQSIRDTTASLQTMARLRHLTGNQSVSTPTRTPLPVFRHKRPYAS